MRLFGRFDAEEPQRADGLNLDDAAQLQEKRFPGGVAFREDVVMVIKKRWRACIYETCTSGRRRALLPRLRFSSSREGGCKNAGATCKLVGMPELPDIAAYISALEPRIVGQPIERVRLASVFLLRTVQPPIASVEGRIVRELRRIGKRIAIGVEGDLWLVLHLMIAGRLHWRPPGAKLSGRKSLAAFDFPDGSLVLTEAGSKRRASLHVLSGEEGLRFHRPGRNRDFHERSELVSRRADGRKSHAQEGSYRSAHGQRHRQRVFGRDSARGATVADRAHAQTRAAGVGKAVRCNARDAESSG